MPEAGQPTSFIFGTGTSTLQQGRWLATRVGPQASPTLTFLQDQEFASLETTDSAFQAILAAELKPDLASALQTRLNTSPAASVSKVFTGDCNSIVDEMIPHIPKRALTLAFIDPEAMNVEFDTIRKLASCGQVDLLILFADRMDLVRNVDRYYAAGQSSTLDRMMEPQSRWRELWPQLVNRSPDNICQLFVKEFQAQLKTLLGYNVFGAKTMHNTNGPIYRLIFASKNAKGLEFWDKVT